MVHNMQCWESLLKPLSSPLWIPAPSGSEGFGDFSYSKDVGLIVERNKLIMMATQYDPTAAGAVFQATSAATPQTDQPTVMPTPEAMPIESTQGSPAEMSETVASQAVDGGALPNVPALTMQNGLQSVLILVAVLLVLLLIWRRGKRSDRIRFQVLPAEPNRTAARPTGYTQRPGEQTAAATLSRGALTTRSGLEDNEETSMPKPAHAFNFDDEATYLYTPQVNRQLVGHLVRVTSEARFPAELALMVLPSVQSNEEKIAIGRHSKYNTVVIGDKSVSRQHAVIVQRGEQLFVRDNDSSAGTLLNWKRLRSTDEPRLHHQDILTLGEAVYEVRLRQEELPGAA